MIELAFALALAATQQSPKEAPLPPACVGPTFVSWQACADAAVEGSPAYSLAMINLGTEAYVQGDYESALRHYDKARGEGQVITSDVIFHAFRGDTYQHAGRVDAAREDAALAWGYLTDRPPAGTDPRDVRPLNNEIRAMVLTAILPILKDGDAATFTQAREMYIALPANDWMALSNRSTVLQQLGEVEAAIADSKRAVDMAPNEPGPQNNHCYALVELGRASEGLPYCERAVALVPEVPQVRHSYAAALAAVGRCTDAERQLAEARRLDPSSALYREPITCTPKA